VKILTGNDLKTGAVVWWDGANWSLHVEDSADVGGEGEAIAARENAARRVVGPYVIDGERTAAKDGTATVRPAHIKDRVRAVGPTVRLDLGVKPADPAAGSWVI
jgi:hypothetical protein